MRPLQHWLSLSPWGLVLTCDTRAQADAPKLVQQVEAVQRLVGPEVGRRLVLIVQNL